MSHHERVIPQKFGTRGISSGLLLATVSSLGFAAAPVITKFAYRAGVTPTRLLSLRFVFSSVALALLVLIRPRRTVRSGRNKMLFLIVGVAFGIQSYLFFTALNHLPATTATLIFFSYPLAVNIWNLSTRRTRATGLLISAIVANTLGLIFVINPTARGSTIGIVCALGSALVYAMYVLVTGSWMEGASPIEGTLYVNVGAAIFWFILASSEHSLWLPSHPNTWAVLLYLAFVPSIIGIVFLAASVKRLGAGLFSIVSTSEPIFTACFAAVLIGIGLRSIQYAGGALIVGSTIAATLSSSNVPHQIPPEGPGPV